MFQDYQIQKYLGYEQVTHTDKYQALIIDSDFTESIIVSISADARRPTQASSACALSLIKVYERRQLDVSHNLYLLCCRIQKRYNWYLIISQLTDYEEYIKEYYPYRKQVLAIHNRYMKQKAFW